MSFRITVKADRTAETSRRIQELATKVVEKCARDIEANASVNCQTMGAIDTGNLLNSIAAMPVEPDGSRWKVIAGAEYAAYVNYGTSRMEARPFFTDGVDKVRPVFAAAMKQLPGVA